MKSPIRMFKLARLQSHTTPHALRTQAIERIVKKRSSAFRAGMGGDHGLGVPTVNEANARRDYTQGSECLSAEFCVINRAQRRE
jgi:hypothetical protein